MANCENEIVIGVLGGMGTYATVHLFRQYAEIFRAEKEWNRPRIIIDNRCTMPSRVKAYLYGENRQELVEEMEDSLKSLDELGCSCLLLGCITSHLFLPEIYKKNPKLELKIIDIVNACTEKVVDDNVKNIFIIGSEGTIESNIFQSYFDKQCKSGEICCITPNKDDYKIIRECIEAVKQDNYSNMIKEKFLSIVNHYEACILGCTEFPVLHERYKRDITCKKIYDPVHIGLNKIKTMFDDVSE